MHQNKKYDFREAKIESLKAEIPKRPGMRMGGKGGAKNSLTSRKVKFKRADFKKALEMGKKLITRGATTHARTQSKQQRWRISSADATLVPKTALQGNFDLRTCVLHHTGKKQEKQLCGVKMERWRCAARVNIITWLCQRKSLTLPWPLSK